MAGKMPEISVNLKLISASFEKGFAKAEKSLNKFDRTTSKMGKSMDKLAGTIGKLGTIAATAFVGFISYKVINGMRDLATQMSAVTASAGKLGMSSADLIKFNHAASEIGISSETMADGLRDMVKNIGEAAAGNETAGESFRKLGLSISDLSNMKGADQFKAITSALEGIENQTERTQVAMKLFGEKGIELARLTSEGLEQAAIDAEYLGITFNDRTAQGIDNANHAAERLGLAFDGVSQRISASLAPSMEILNNLATDMVVYFGKDIPGSAGVASDGIGKFAKFGIKALKGLGKAIIVISGMLQTVMQGYAQIGHAAQIAGAKFKTAATELGDFFSGSKSATSAKFIKQYADDAKVASKAISAVSKQTDKLYASMGKGMADIDAMSIKFKEYDASASKAGNTNTNFSKSLGKVSNKAKKAGKSLKKMSKSAKKVGEKLTEVRNEMLEFITGKFEDGFTRIFRSAMDGASSFKEVMGSVVKDILAQLFRVYVVQKAISAITGISGGGSSGGAMSMFASGGIINSRMTMGNNIVGEAGPEAILPLTRLSNGNMGVQVEQQPIQVNVSNYGNENVQVDESEGKIDIVIGRVIDQINRGGAVGTAIQNRYGLGMV